jgi:hypothetical protein
VLPNSRYPKQPNRIAFFDQLLEQVRAVPGVQMAGAVSALPMSPLGNDFSLDFTIDGLASASPTERPRAAYRGVLAGYFEAMGIALQQGRLFDVRRPRRACPRRRRQRDAGPPVFQRRIRDRPRHSGADGRHAHDCGSGRRHEAAGFDACRGRTCTCRTTSSR